MGASAALGAVAFALIDPAVVITAAGRTNNSFRVIRAFYQLVKDLTATVTFKIKYRHFSVSEVKLSII